MPTIYRGECSRCGHETSVLPAGYGAVLVDEPVNREQHQVLGAVVLEGKGGEFATATDGYLVVLSHPAESSILKSTGFTWNDLRREGRYVYCTNVMCDECGQLFALKRIAVPQSCSGCYVPLIAGIVAGLAVGIWLSSVILGWFAALVVGYLATITTEWWARRSFRDYFSERAAKLRAERFCPACGSEASKTITDEGPLCCPSCQQSSLRFRIVGKS